MKHRKRKGTKKRGRDINKHKQTHKSKILMDEAGKKKNVRE
jgi:hypothetical protein